MANNKQRYINTRLWNDIYVAQLDPVEKLLFVYLLTNEHTNISGIYEVPLKILAIETGLDESMLIKIFGRLHEKINYIDGKVVIKNFVKHQETSSPNVKKGIVNCLEEFNKDFLQDVIERDIYRLPKDCLDTLCIPYIEGRNYLDSNLDSNSKREPEKKEYNSLSYLKKIPEADMKEFEEKFKVEKANVITKANSLYDYCEAKGKRYKNYKSFLANALRKDFGERPPKPKKPIYDLSSGTAKIVGYE